MTSLASASVTSTAPPSAFFDRWADVATWPEWNLDTEWVRLDGPFAQGATGSLKPRGGPKVPFAVTRLDGTRFTDVSRLFGARLVFDHGVSTGPRGTTVDVEVTLDGPLATLWRSILGKGLRASVRPDLERLARVAETATAASHADSASARTADRPA